MPRPPLICHIIYRLAVGGLENGLVNLVNNLPDDAYRHAIVCVTGATEFRNRIRRNSVEIHEINKKPGKDFAAYGRMWRLLNRLKPRVVHTRNLPALDSLAPAWLAGVPKFVHSEHGLDMIEVDGKNFKYNLLRRASRLIVDRYVTVSRDLHDWLHNEIGVPESRLQTIYNGVDTERFSPMGRSREALPPGFAPEGATVIGTFGRLDPLKNQLALARAFARILAARPAARRSLRLMIVGEGKQRAEIEAALDEGGVRDLAWMPGFRDDTADLYRALDIFVLPSLREGISNTLLEAMASGRPVVATRVGGNPEIVPEDVAGLLVPVDDAEALAAAIQRYLDAPALARAHGDGARAHVLRHYSLAAMVGSYDRIYRSLLPSGAI
ncbi:MAG TPA: TIGR03088 family PEP-CTERM/XrtA system glycosyltransferase [Stellaceae bacterium]|nr:TIGR03088 family PEP-CTERM/XrtA system glycosyltransferase [Stellaceae bacterium]